MLLHFMLQRQFVSGTRGVTGDVMCGGAGSPVGGGVHCPKSLPLFVLSSEGLVLSKEAFFCLSCVKKNQKKTFVQKTFAPKTTISCEELGDSLVLVRSN